MKTHVKTNLAEELEKRLFWWRVGANIFQKLYGPLKTREFYRDSKSLCASIYQFRNACSKGRGWSIPAIEQEKLLGKLISRCQEAIAKDAVGHDYIPGYLGKSLSKFVDEIADEAQRKWKSLNISDGYLPQEVLKGLIEATLARVVTEKVESL